MQNSHSHFHFTTTEMIETKLIAAQYDYVVVFLSVCVAIFSSYISFILISQINKSSFRGERFFWIALSSFFMGLGIWAMHFIGMLGYILPLEVEYNVPITLLSLIPSIIASYFVIFSQSTYANLNGVKWAKNSLIMGAGIGSMHYVGMMAMTMKANMAYDPYIFTLSIVIAVVLAGISLKINVILYSYENKVFLRRAFSSIVMGCAISSMHYMGMQAMYVFETPETVYSYPPINFQFIETIIMVIIVLSVIAMASVELRAKILLSSHLKLVLNTVQDAVISFNKKGIIEYVNPSTVSMFGYETSELIGVNVRTLMPDSTVSQFNKMLLPDYQVNNTKGIDNNHLLEGQTKKGSKFPITLSVGGVSEGSSEHFVGTIRDMTDLKNQEAFMQTVFDTVPHMLFVKKADDLSFVHLNNAGEQLLGKKQNDVIGKTDFDLFSKEEARFFVETDRKTLLSKQPQKINEESLTTDGKTRFLRTNKAVIKNPIGDADFLLGVSEDITELRETELKLEYLNQRLSLAAEAANIGVWEWNLETKTLVWDEWMLKLYGIEGQVVNSFYDAWLQALHPDDVDEAMAALNDAIKNKTNFHVEFRIILPDGNIRYIQSDGRMYSDNKLGRRMIGTNIDISKRMIAQAEALSLARLDHLTGIANRAELSLFVDKEFARAQRKQSLIGCLYFDLDKFKPINDNYGHKTGDQILVAVAQRLKSQVRADDMVARIGGDEFVIILTEIQNKNQIEAAAARFLASFKEKIITDNGAFYLEFSVGYSIYPTESLTLDELLHVADERMYEHKQLTN